MTLFSRLFHRDSYKPEDDGLVRGLHDASEHERQRAAEIRRQRRTGNFLADRLLLPRPEVEREQQHGGGR